MSTAKELSQTPAVAAPANIATVEPEDSQAADQSTQYLTFSLAGEEYGVDILRVQEIKGWTPVTRVPNTPSYMQGVLNMRGSIVPIVDLRMRFNLEEAEYTPTTVVIVVSVVSETGQRTLGVVVDGVSDVVSVPSSELKPTPDFGTNVNTEFIQGLATPDEKMVMLLDVDKLLASDELAEIGDHVAEQTDKVENA